MGLDPNSFSVEDRDIFQSTIDLVTSVLNFPMGGICLYRENEISLVGSIGLDKVKGFCRDDAFCSYTMQSDDVFTVNDAILDSRFQNNLYVSNPPFIGSFAGIPLMVEGHGKVGTLFIADHSPKKFSHEQLNILKAFSKQIQSMLSDKHIKNKLLLKKEESLNNLLYFAHDLKNPMTIVKTSLDLLKMKDAECLKSDRLISRCQNNLKKAFLTIDELLSAEKLKAANNQIIKKDICLKEALSKLSRKMQYLFTENQRIVLDVKDMVIHSDDILLLRVIENLISNAIKYGDGSDVVIKAKKYRGNVMISVTDEGSGIADSEKEKIFQMGYKKGNSYYPSHGIGLHFCRYAISSLGGDLSVKDNRPQGSIFTIRLPL